MDNSDYYAILNVPQGASLDDIKKSYRKLALETHPDRNPGDLAAEERFKRINEAYGVLSDPAKRLQYDQYRRTGYRPHPGGPHGPGFGFTQEDIFRDFFTASQHRDIFSEMQREFARMGFRFDENFINRLFFGGKGTFYQSMFFTGPGSVRIIRVGPQSFRRAGRRPGPPPGRKSPKPRGLFLSSLFLLARAGKKAGELISRALGGVPAGGPRPGGRIAPHPEGPDLTYRLQITRGQAREGVIVEVELPHLESPNRFSVRIPPGVHSGTRLRLKEMGQLASGQPEARGDLFIELLVA